MVKKLEKIIGERYQILKELGRGAFGQTYLAQDLQQPTQPKCVVKHLKPQASDELTLKEAKRLFVSEAEVLGKLSDSPQIPSLIAYYGDNFCLVQEFVDGHDLSKEIRVGHPLNEEQIIAILNNLLPVLSFIHQNNVIHRDIKPSNIRRAKKDGSLFLIDFGAVKEIKTLVLTGDGQPKPSIVAGTQGYMPPEQLRGRPRLNSDIYALGVICIEALTGKAATQLEEDPETGDLKWREGLEVSEELAEILETMTRADFGERYQSAEAVIKDLEDLNKTGKTDLKERIKQKKRDRAGKKWYSWLPLGGVAVMVGLGIFLFPTIRAVYLFNKANGLVREGEYRDAIALYDKGLEKYASSAQAWLNRGFALAQLRRFEEQLSSCDQALEFNPEFVEALNCKGLALDELGRNEEAITFFEQAVQLDRDFYQAWNNQGEVLMELKRQEEALEAFDRAKLYDPDYLFAWNNRGNALFQLERYAEAIAAYDEAIEINPEYPYPWNGRGNARRKLGRYEKAIADYDQAIELKSNFYEAWYNKGLTFLAMDEKEKALAAFDEAVQIKPDYQAAINLRSKLRDNLSDQ
ncbi:serine/threonine protein kinase [Halothece sp. PCC 7418]|uniref:serine/threonine-protein kinase n=1 Tax=Halothece sp. (strain PCC 7418) TaxID=65093 RepID=UPI0002A07363|nr:serine/threonine-protein kinase [Halothece sp. PCC 7418]AFZ42484.1 serine/threonine protein kinase [Halothece sp. PCC 7418]